MFKKIDGYIAKHIVGYTLVVLLALLSIEFLIRLITDVDHLGEKDFTLGTLLMITFSFVPIKVIHFFPISLVIGSLLGLNKLAAGNELTVMMVSGASKFHISVLGIVIASLLGIGALWVNEYIGVPLNKKAMMLRSHSLGRVFRDSSNTGAWIQNDNSFIYVGALSKTGEMSDIRIYQTRDNQSLKKIITAESAQLKETGWQLNNATLITGFDKKLEKKENQNLFWANTIDMQVMALLISSPEDLLTTDLNRYLTHQKNNGVDATQYGLIYWERLFMPLSSAVMFLLALPFVFGSQRTQGQGVKLFIGLLIGIVYHVSSASISNLTLLTGIPVVVGALLPIVIFSSISLSLLWIRK